MGADALGVIMDAFKQCKAREGLPFLLFVGEMRNTVTRAGFSVEVEMQGKERNIVERLREGRIGLGKDKVPGFHDGESSLSYGERLAMVHDRPNRSWTHFGSSSDVAGSDCSVVIGESHDISPEAIVDE
jgi:hypothetical protein